MPWFAEARVLLNQNSSRKIHIDLLAKRVRVSGEYVELTAYEYELLEYLIDTIVKSSQTAIARCALSISSGKYNRSDEPPEKINSSRAGKSGATIPGKVNISISGGLMI